MEFTSSLLPHALVFLVCFSFSTFDERSNGSPGVRQAGHYTLPVVAAAHCVFSSPFDTKVTDYCESLCSIDFQRYRNLTHRRLRLDSSGGGKDMLSWRTARCRCITEWGVLSCWLDAPDTDAVFRKTSCPGAGYGIESPRPATNPVKRPGCPGERSCPCHEKTVNERGLERLLLHRFRLLCWRKSKAGTRNAGFLPRVPTRATGTLVVGPRSVTISPKLFLAFLLSASAIIDFVAGIKRTLHPVSPLARAIEPRGKTILCRDLTFLNSSYEVRRGICGTSLIRFRSYVLSPFVHPLSLSSSFFFSPAPSLLARPSALFRADSHSPPPPPSPLTDDALLVRSVWSRKLADLGVDSGDVEEQCVLGGGKGGQKINKTNSCVVLVHAPSHIVIRCQRTRYADSIVGVVCTISPYHTDYQRRSAAVR